MSDGTAAVTGATGFVGRHVARALLRDGWRVRLLVRDARRLAADLRGAPGVEIVKGGLDDAAALEALVAGAGSVVHVAGAIAALRRADFLAINAEASGRLAELAAQAGVGRFVHVSSLAARYRDISPYAHSKRLSEDMVRAAAGGMAVSVVRPPAVYGPEDRSTLGLFDQLTRRHAVLPVAPAQRLSLIHVADLADLLARLTRAEVAPEMVLEPDDGTAGGHDWPGLAEMATEVLQRPVRVHFLPRALVRSAARVADALARVRGRPFVFSGHKVAELYHTDWVARGDKPEDHLDWRPGWPFKKGFLETLRWYCAQGWLPRHRLPGGEAMEGMNT